MGSRYLTDMADVLRDNGLDVVEVSGWEFRARSSGGYESSRPTAIMWHHTASDTSAQNDVNYICYGSPDAPIANLYLARDGQVWVCAGGCTNTNGKGGPVTVSKGVVPVDSMNSYAIGIEAANNGIGQTWPQAQIDAYFAVNNALTAAYGLIATDCLTHHEWAPDRKIDPATAWAVDGPWQPRSATSSGTWSGDDVRGEAARRTSSAPTPPPIGDDDMQIRLYQLTDADAEFLAATTETGQALWVVWAGPDSPEVTRAVQMWRGEAGARGHPFETSRTVADMYPCVLHGGLPYGDRYKWQGTEFWRIL